MDYLAEIIASLCTVSVADCYGFLITKCDAMGEQLADGKIVKLERLGTFALTLKGIETNEPEKLNKNTIK
ncbi:hypothetical protein [Flavobacterium sp.]|uniref:HU family DNA-binding protein n=1 Tax=Flavobacterium sp. TaxID=239 RepID=UPI003F69BF1D